MGENNVGELKQLATSIPSFSRPMQASLATFFLLPLFHIVKNIPLEI
jgi:hypothetical protein